MKLKTLVALLATLFCISCNAGSPTQQLQFETISGTITKPVSDSDLPFDSVTLTYKISWPVKGNPETVSFVKSQIINLIGVNDINSGEQDIDAIINSIASKLLHNAKDEFRWQESIEVLANENTPFDSYLTIIKSTEDQIYMSRPIYTKDAVTIRLADNKLFPGNNAICDEEMMKGLITVYLEKAGKSEDSDWQWHENIMCDKYQVPMPRTPLILTKEGVSVRYNQYEISDGAHGSFECVIPYDEVVYALTDETKEFLNMKSESVKTEEPVKQSVLDEKSAIDLIKKANNHDLNALSTEFKTLWTEPNWNGDWVLFEYGDAPDCVSVKNPEIKINKIIPSNDGKELTAIFDFIDKDAPHMGWISKQDYHSKICAMNFILENGKWVVDDYLTAWNSSFDQFNINDAASTKSNFRFILENQD